MDPRVNQRSPADRGRATITARGEKEREREEKRSLVERNTLANPLEAQITKQLSSAPVVGSHRDWTPSGFATALNLRGANGCTAVKIHRET